MAEPTPVSTSTTETVAIEPRFPASAVPSITGVRLSPGETVQLINISRTGVLVEGRTRFVPGTRVTVILEGTFRPSQIKGRIVRCQVSSIHEGSLRYQSGIQFDKKLDAHPAELQDLQAEGVKAAPSAAPAPESAAAKGVETPPPLMNRW
ncbi:MAG TPA: PilZ domain-containing protein [Vicinamibacterales bacterium]|nr:PilZ domain-containing protein [Vicinamibacterales bacterium]